MLGKTARQVYGTRRENSDGTGLHLEQPVEVGLVIHQRGPTSGPCSLPA